MDGCDDWIEVKKSVHSKENCPTISEGEIWWCAVGKNVGIEINGKSRKFSRPVLVFKKLSKLGFWACLLLHKIKLVLGMQVSSFRKKKETAALCQIKVISVSRLYKKIGKIPETDFAIVKNGFLRLYG